ncbi:MAG: hypothetical protein KEFWMYNX_001948 [Candidatus Fervidibacter sp.]
MPLTLHHRCLLPPSASKKAMRFEVDRTDAPTLPRLRKTKGSKQVHRHYAAGKDWREAPRRTAVLPYYMADTVVCSYYMADTESAPTIRYPPFATHCRLTSCQSLIASRCRSRVGLFFQQPMLHGELDDLCPRLEPQLVGDATAVSLHRLDAQRQPLGDLLVRVTQRN